MFFLFEIFLWKNWICPDTLNYCTSIANLKNYLVSKLISNWHLTAMLSLFRKSSSKAECTFRICMSANQSKHLKSQRQPCRGVLSKRKYLLKICSKFTGEHPCRSMISIEITFQHGCSPVNLQHTFRTPFTKNPSEQLLLVNAFVMAEFSYILFF